MPWAAQPHSAKKKLLIKKTLPSAYYREENRLQAHERGYDDEWRHLAIAFKKENPWCVRCLSKDQKKLEPVALVDHVVPIRVAPHLRLEWSNLQSLCRPCHSAKTLEDMNSYPEFYDSSKEIA